MTLTIPFDNSYAALPQSFYARQLPEPVSDPKLLAFNAPLAAELGISGLVDLELAEYFSGNQIPHGATPLAQAYAGHQFGGFSPQLGDGRAILLGEVLDQHGQRRDIQLKGSGRTPFSRRGDGRAWLGPVLREYVLSEAMHALGIPTTRALAAVSTGDRVQRERGLPGAVLTRVASSHIRVGTFQYFYARQDVPALEQLFTYARDRHYPEAQTPLDFLRAVIARQVSLVTQWLSIGFIHGVMNTDNTAISGETIDYGPAAFMDVFHPVTVYSSIDHQGRYSYDNQPNIIAWNMAQLATALVPICDNPDVAVRDFTEAVNGMGAQLKAAWRQVFGRKIGLAEAAVEDEGLITDLLAMMAETKSDFTNSFRALSTEDDLGDLADHRGFADWHHRWQQRLQSETDPIGRMRRSNPAFIPRNHRIDQMIQAAISGNYAPFERLIQVLAAPYDDQPDALGLTQPPRPEEEVTATFCGT